MEPTVGMTVDIGYFGTGCEVLVLFVAACLLN